jgi:hypothetical protein
VDVENTIEAMESTNQNNPNHHRSATPRADSHKETTKEIKDRLDFIIIPFSGRIYLNPPQR